MGSELSSRCSDWFSQELSVIKLNRRRRPDKVGFVAHTKLGEDEYIPNCRADY